NEASIHSGAIGAVERFSLRWTIKDAEWSEHAGTPCRSGERLYRQVSKTSEFSNAIRPRRGIPVLHCSRLRPNRLSIRKGALNNCGRSIGSTGVFATFTRSKSFLCL